MGWICFITLMAIRLSGSLNFCPIAETVMQSLGSGRSQMSPWWSFPLHQSGKQQVPLGALARARWAPLSGRKKDIKNVRGSSREWYVAELLWNHWIPQIHTNATAPAFWGRKWFALQEEKRACFCLHVVVSSYSALQMSNSDIPVSQYSSKTLRFPLSF